MTDRSGKREIGINEGRRRPDRERGVSTNGGQRQLDRVGVD